MSIGALCNREVVVVHRGTEVLEAARLMRRHHVGTLVVVEAADGGNVPVGIVTDRDLVLEVLALEIEPTSVCVEDLMTHSLETAHENDDLLDILRNMQEKGIRRLPVVNARGCLEGLITLDDALELLSEQISDLVKLIARQQQRERWTRR